MVQSHLSNNENTQMPSSIQNRTPYLVLAEFCQKVISTLLDYINGTKPLEASTLQDVAGRLQSVQSGDPYRFGQRSAVALSSYEEVRILEEVWKPQKIQEAVNLISALLADGSDEQSKRAKAETLVALFSTLQTRSLWYFEQPREASPPDLGDLCEVRKTA